MKEVAFIKQNKEKWKEFEVLLKEKSTLKPDKLAEIYIAVTDDLSFARTYYIGRPVAQYLNELASGIHYALYKTKPEKKSRFITFWTKELPEVMAQSQKELLYSFVIFLVGTGIGVLSAANDDSFVRLILGDSYVNMTLENIKNGDPMGVYKKMGSESMFVMITMNNIKVSFYVYAAAIFTSIGSGLMLLYNAVMLGSFQYFFYQKGLFLTSFLTIWTHGTLEISAIIIAGAAGIIMGNGFLFPGTYKRIDSFTVNARRGVKIIVGLLPIFITAGFLESFVTRLTEMPMILKIFIILASFSFILYYFVIIPNRIRIHGTKN